MLLATLAVAGLTGWAALRAVDGDFDESVDTPAVPFPDTPEMNRLRRFAVAIAPLYVKLPPPEPDDWLASHTEFGQTFQQLLTDRPDKLCGRYRRLCVVPLGNFSDTQRRLFADAAVFLEQFFGFPVESLEPLSLASLPEEAQRARESGVRQLHAGSLLSDILLPRLTDETVAVVGIANTDLWDGDFNFLYGQGSPVDRVCVCSTARLGNVDAGEVDYATVLRRLAGLAAHETGHVMGLPHCVAWSCRMNGSKHLAESDRRPLEFCPECLPKIWWTCGVDPQQRFSQLATFAAEHRLNRDEKLWRETVRRLDGANTKRSSTARTATKRTSNRS